MTTIHKIRTITAKSLLLLLCVVLLTQNTVFAEKADLPDPARFFSALGELLAEDDEVDGVTYNIYGYEFTKAASSNVANVVTAYNWKVTAAGFRWEALRNQSNDAGDYWYAMTRDGQTAFLNLQGSYHDTSCAAALYVPKGMPFTLEKNLNGTSSFQNPSYFSQVQDYPSTSSFQNPSYFSQVQGSPNTSSFQNGSYLEAAQPYLDDGIITVTCVSCHGTGRCGICHGTGVWTNGYTGDRNDCSCKNGVCTVCDGSGKW